MNPTETPDAELIGMCLAGSEKAWDALLARYERLIYHTALRAGADSEEIGDIFQAVCVIWLQQLGRLRDPERLGAWLVTTTRRECWARWRSDQRREDRLALAAADGESSPETPEALAAQAGDARAVHRAIQKLGEPCRHLLGMLYFEPDRPTYAALAKALKVPQNSIGPLRVRCLRKLRELLLAEGW